MSIKQTDTRQLAANYFRHSYAKTVAVLVHYFGLDHVEVAEDMVQDTLVEAMEKWSVQGIPDNPGGWIMDVAKKKTINFLKRRQLFETKIASRLQDADVDDVLVVSDSTLQMIFACCHPQLPPESQIALALKTLCGLSVPEVANALLTTESTINKRLYRAKKRFKDGSITLAPTAQMDGNRLGTVLHVLYLLFNEGYFSVHHSEKIRLDLCYEAIRLLRLVASSFPDSGRAKALLALTHLSVARFESRTGPLGQLIALEQQDRALWDHTLISRGMDYLTASIQTGEVNSYQLQAGILAEHCLAKDFQSTNWKSIYRQYELLEQLAPQPIVTLNKTIARFHLGSKQEALKDLELLQHDPSYTLSVPLALTQAILWRAIGKSFEAQAAFERAYSLCSSDHERELIKSRMK